MNCKRVSFIMKKGDKYSFFLHSDQVNLFEKYHIKEKWFREEDIYHRDIFINMNEVSSIEVETESEIEE